MGDPKLGDLAVRLDVVGHASPRWRGAKNTAERDRLNRALSEQRAQNVRKAVEEDLRRELPNLPIVVPSAGVGSQERFPTAGEDNAAIDRSAVLSIELTTRQPSYKLQYPAHRRMYVPSKVWTLRVHTMFRGAALGYVQIHLRIGLINPYSGNELILTGWLSGGGSAMDVKDSFKISTSPYSAYKDLRELYRDRVGRDVVFQTREALDFDDLAGGNGGQRVRLDKLDVSLGLRSYDTCLVFTDLDTSPDTLCFQHKFLTVGKIKADAFVVQGRLQREGPMPSDFLELPNYPDMIPTQSTHNFFDALVLSFPTGKAGLNDLTQKDRDRMRRFVENKARAIAELSKSFTTTAPRP